MNQPLTIPSNETLNSIRKKHHLSLLLLHGSHVRGLVYLKSDVDIAVVRQLADKLDLLALIRDLAEAFVTDRIDVVDLTHADPLLLYAVTTNSQLLSGTQKAYASVQLRAFHRYSDYKTFLSAEKQFVYNRLHTYVTTG